MPLIKLPSSLLSTAFCICHSLSHCSCCLWRFSFKIGFLPLFSLRTIVCPTTKGSGDIVRTIITRKPLSLFFITSFCSRSHSFCHRSSSTGLESYLSRQSSLATTYPLHSSTYLQVQDRFQHSHTTLSLRRPNDSPAYHINI